MTKMIVLSNRTAADTGLRAGGLAVAVFDALKSSNGVWLGWSGTVSENAPRGVSFINSDGVDYVLSDLSQREFDGYYLHYANRMIWPVFHYRVDLAQFGQDEFDTYKSVNQRFADLALTQARDGDVIWVHDYHFLMAAESLRQRGWNGRVGFFLHIPFPSPEIFRALPQHQWLARAMAQYDVVGFQTERDLWNFRHYMEDDCDATLGEDGAISVFGRTLTARAYPIGIDPEAFSAAAESEPATHAAKRIGRFLGEKRHLIIGVDRMDYSKGLPERFEAVGQLFDQYKDVHGAVSYTQITPPSRSKVEEYQVLRTELDGLAGRINGDYGDLDWIPIRYLARAYGRDELAGLFRIARVGLVTPLRDGMNLVAKEFVAAQNPEDPGVLILSEFAGAAEQLKDAILVNPHDYGQVADAIYHALQMPRERRIELWRALWDNISSHDISWWRRRFLDDLNPPHPA